MADLLSVSREKKKPHVGFVEVWNGDRELERRGVEEDGRDPARDGCMTRKDHSNIPFSLL